MVSGRHDLLVFLACFVLETTHQMAYYTSKFFVRVHGLCCEVVVFALALLRFLTVT